MIQTTRPTYPREWKDPQPTIIVRYLPVVRQSRAGIKYTSYKAFGFAKRSFPKLF